MFTTCRMFSMHRTILSLCGALLLATVTATATAPPANASNNCPDHGYVCVWNDVYSGAMQPYGATAAGWVGEFDTIKRSIVNNFDNRAVWTFNILRGAFQGYDCVNPGDRKGGGRFWTGALWIDAPGTRCHGVGAASTSSSGFSVAAKRRVARCVARRTRPTLATTSGRLHGSACTRQSGS